MMEKSPSRNLELIKTQVAIEKKAKRLLEAHNFKPSGEGKKPTGTKRHDKLYKEGMKK